MRRIKAEIRELTGLTCSVGISESRMLAKMTSELGKPNGLVVVSREDALARFGGGPPGVVPGIGPKTVERLEKLGISTLAALGEWDRGDLEERFGPRSGAWLHARGNLRDETPISVTRETKSQSVETTFDVDVGELTALERTLREQTEELCRRLRKKELEGRSIGIKVRLDDWTNVTRSQSVENPTNDPEVVWPIALDLLRAYDPPRPVRLLGVRLASFDNEADIAAEEDEPQLRLTLPG